MLKKNKLKCISLVSPWILIARELMKSILVLLILNQVVKYNIKKVKFLYKDVFLQILIKYRLKI